jgi:hypothetical protein
MRLVRSIAAAAMVGVSLFVAPAPKAAADAFLSTSTQPGWVPQDEPAAAPHPGMSETAEPSLASRLASVLGREGMATARAMAGRRAELPEGRISYDRAWIDRLPRAGGGPAWQCLTEALYFEARGESVRGQFAVAEVILNRVDSHAYPDTVCAVVNQGTGRRYQCQFTYTCDGHAERVHERGAWTRAGKIARLMLDDGPRALTHGATHYHTKAVSPRWSRAYPRTATIGVHHFYRSPRS